MNAENFYKKHLVLGDVDLNKQTPLTHQGVIHIMDIYHQNQLMLGDVKEQSEQLNDFVEWWHGLSQEELAWYDGRYVEVFLSL